MKEKSKERIKIESKYIAFLKEKESIVRIPLSFYELPKSYDDEKIFNLIDSRKKIVKGDINKKNKTIKRFDKFNIYPERFYNAVATKSTYLCYMTLKSFKELKLEEINIVIDKKDVTVYLLIDVLDEAYKRKTKIRLLRSSPTEPKLKFIENCFLNLSSLIREDELRLKMEARKEENVKIIKKKI